jgi:hypothetical protein
VDQIDPQHTGREGEYQRGLKQRSCDVPDRTGNLICLRWTRIIAVTR